MLDLICLERSGGSAHSGSPGLGQWGHRGSGRGGTVELGSGHRGLGSEDMVGLGRGDPGGSGRGDTVELSSDTGVWAEVTVSSVSSDMVGLDSGDTGFFGRGDMRLRPAVTRWARQECHCHPPSSLMRRL